MQISEKEYFKELKQFEKKYFPIISHFDTSFPKPLNLKEERRKFFSAIADDKIYNPQIKFQKKEFPEKQIELLKQLTIDTKNDLYGFKELYKQRIVTKLHEIECHRRWGDPTSTHYVELYRGKPNWMLVQKAKQFCRTFKREKIKFKELTPEETAERLVEEVHKLTGDIVCIEYADTSSKVNIDPHNKIIKLNPIYRFTTRDIKRLNVHEIGTHYMRYYNGKKTKVRLLQIGTSNYIETEEGLAAYMEEVKGVSSKAQMYIYAGRVIATYLVSKKSFYQIFQTLKSYGFKDEDAFAITYRAKRNISDTSKKGGFTKDYVYFSGYHKIKKYAKTNDIRDLFIGKVKIEDLKLIKKFLKKNRENITTILEKDE